MTKLFIDYVYPMKNKIYFDWNGLFWKDNPTIHGAQGVMK